MKQLEKLERELAKAGLGEHVYDGAKLRMIEKINELVDAFNELNRTTRKIIFVEDEETKIPAAKKKKVK